MANRANHKFPGDGGQVFEVKWNQQFKTPKCQMSLHYSSYDKDIVLWLIRTGNVLVLDSRSM